MPAVSQDLDEAYLVPQPGEEASREELRAFRMFQMRKFVRARELATAVVEEDANSVVGHFVLALVHRHGEANFPRALYHAERAFRLFEQEHGTEPTATDPWAWRMRLLVELAQIHGELEHHREKLRYLARYNDAYDPDLIADQAWPLMKLGEFEAARRVADRALSVAETSADGAREKVVALNALCAIEFEAGNDGVSYEACARALEYGKTQAGGASVVDYMNYAEAARSLFRFAEAERISLKATKAASSWYGNPWLELSELYTREGRFAESLAALREMGQTIEKRPPHTRNADLHERWRAIASFLVTVGRSQQALEVTEKAVHAPDRSGFRSRDAEQDQAVMALLHRRAQLLEVERLGERLASRSWLWNWTEQLATWSSMTVLRISAWAAGRDVARSLSDEGRLVGTFRIGTAASGIMPPWLAGELVEVLGNGVVRAAVERAQQADQREGAAGYYNAFLCEAALHGGEDARAIELGERALQALGPEEALLRARVLSLIASATGNRAQAGEGLGRRYELALQLDPGVFRKRQARIPVSFVAGAGSLSRDGLAFLERSPRFEAVESGLEIHADVSPAEGEICLQGVGGAVLSCHRDRPAADEAPSDYLVRLLDGFHQAVFAPRIDLSQADIHSLDGSSRVGRDLLDGTRSPNGDE